MRRGKIKGREAAAALLGAGVAAVLWLAVLRRDTPVAESLLLPPFQSLLLFWKDIITYGFRGNILGNIIAFAPIGFFHPAAFGAEDGKRAGKWYRTMLFGVCLSLLIETAQLVFARGFFDLDDILLNTAGTLAGYGLYRAVFARLGTSGGEEQTAEKRQPADGANG